MVAFFLAFGWFALVQERIALGGKRGGEAAIVEGHAATVFAFVQFAIAAGFGALAVRLAAAPRRAYLLVLAVAFLLPTIFLLWRR